MEKYEDFVYTEVGCFNISMPEGEFTYRDKPGFYEYRGVFIVSCLTKVVFKHTDGSMEEIAPTVIESCMNPGKKELVPVTYFAENGKSTIIISNTYKTIEIADTKNFRAIYTKSYEPVAEKLSCNPCRNCGRC